MAMGFIYSAKIHYVCFHAGEHNTVRAGVTVLAWKTIYKL